MSGRVGELALVLGAIALAALKLAAYLEREPARVLEARGKGGKLLLLLMLLMMMRMMQMVRVVRLMMLMMMDETSRIYCDDTGH